MTRAFNSFALRTVPLGDSRCRLEITDYFDMRGWFPTCAPSPIACKALQNLEKLLVMQPAVGFSGICYMRCFLKCGA